MRRTYPLDHAFELPRDDVLALVGGKAANLREMIGLGLPVPPGFVVTTETCRAFLAGGWPDGLDDELRARMAEVEAAVGRRFGDASDPLLVSVRSGAPVSMPGMMDTILDLGLNDATEAGLARASGSEAFARSCRERFEASFRSIVGVADVPDDPWSQLRLAIEAVFRSWNSDRARAYRREGGDRRRPRDRGHGPGDGLRQPRRRLRRRASRSPATPRPASRPSTATCCSTPRARTSWPGPTRPSRSPRSTSGCRPSRAELREYAAPPRAPLRRPVRHRVHHRGRPALVAPGAGRQAQPAGRAADRSRHGRGPGIPAVARGGRRAGRVAAGRSADDDDRPKPAARSRS